MTTALRSFSRAGRSFDASQLTVAANEPGPRGHNSPTEPSDDWPWDDDEPLPEQGDFWLEPTERED